MADPVSGAADVPDPGPAHAAGEHVPDDDPHTHWFLARVASAISSTYRSIDPLVAQLITSPGVLPPEQEADT